MKRLEKLLPPGTDAKRELQSFVLVTLVILLVSTCLFSSRFSTAHGALYVRSFGAQLVYPGRVMPDFRDLTRHILAAFWGGALSAALTAAAHYASFYGESKSVYVMRRIPSRWEIHARCVTVPLCAAAGMLLACFVLLGIFWLMYRFIPPRQCLGALDLDLGRAFL